MSLAYKCDICGKYCDDCYELEADLFDILEDDFHEYGYNKTYYGVRHMCSDCYDNIKRYIHHKILKRLSYEKQ